MATHDERFFALQGAYNVRDIGGYKTNDGKETAMGEFLRADDPSGLTQEDITKLKDAGLALVIDLRSKQEAESKPSALKGIEGVVYENISMLDGVNSGKLEEITPTCMADIYVWLLDNAKDAFAEEMRLFANADGMRLFNCTAGKDRTGTTAMLLLNLAGVSDEDILEDYSLSQVYSAENIKKQQAHLQSLGMDVPDYMFLSNPVDMKKALDYMREHYGEAEDYLLKAGLEKETIEKLKQILVK